MVLRHKYLLPVVTLIALGLFMADVKASDTFNLRGNRLSDEFYLVDVVQTDDLEFVFAKFEPKVTPRSDGVIRAVMGFVWSTEEAAQYRLPYRLQSITMQITKAKFDEMHKLMVQRLGKPRGIYDLESETRYVWLTPDIIPPAFICYIADKRNGIYLVGLLLDETRININSNRPVLDKIFPPIMLVRRESMKPQERMLARWLLESPEW